MIDIPVINEMTQQTNPVNINSVNHYLHVQHIISVSGFAPAVMFWTGAGSTAKMVAPTGTTAKTPTFQLKLAMYGGGIHPVECGARRRGTGHCRYVHHQRRYGHVPFERGRVSYRRHRQAEERLHVYFAHRRAGGRPRRTEHRYPGYGHRPVHESGDAGGAGHRVRRLDVPVVGEGVIGFNPSIIASITVNVSNVTTGHTVQATATATMIDGRTADVTAQAAWTSGTLANATVSESGVVTGVKAGSSDITATLFGVSGKKSVTVTA